MASIIFNIENSSEQQLNDLIASAESAGFETCLNSSSLDVFCKILEQIPDLQSWNEWNGGTYVLHTKKPKHHYISKKNSYIDTFNITDRPRYPYVEIVAKKDNASPIPNYTKCFNMKQISNIYSIPRPTNKKYVVGVISFGGGLYGNILPTGILTGGDVQKYWTALGIPIQNQPTVIIRLLTGAKNNPKMNDGATMENTLDVETIGAACPTSNLTIILYIASNTSTFASVFNYIYTSKINGVIPNLISCSWGLPEIYVHKSDLDDTSTIMQTMTTNGINICVASGDDGSNDGVGGYGNYVDFPSSSPYATAVGGTSLVCPHGVYDSSTVEKTWSGSGGGVSKYFSKPSYQSNISGTNRSTPDLASCADPNTGVIYLIGDSYQIIGGTSVAAPTIAGFLSAIACTKFINPVLYGATSTCFHDIVSGSNGIYKATGGYDNCTGLGSINGAKLKM